MSKGKKPAKIPHTVSGYLHHYVGHLNNSKLFAGIVMILLNIGTKLVPIQISQSAEEYLKKSVGKNLLVFAMAWMGTRDIYTAIGLTFIFIILSEYMFNDKSSLCIVPSIYKANIPEAINNITDSSSKAVSATDITNVIKMLEEIKTKV